MLFFNYLRQIEQKRFEMNLSNLNKIDLVFLLD